MKKDKYAAARKLLGMTQEADTAREAERDALATLAPKLAEAIRNLKSVASSENPDDWFAAFGPCEEALAQFDAIQKGEQG